VPIAGPASAGPGPLPASSEPSAPRTELAPSLDTDLADILEGQLAPVLPGHPRAG